MEQYAALQGMDSIGLDMRLNCHKSSEIADYLKSLLEFKPQNWFCANIVPRMCVVNTKFLC